MQLHNSVWRYYCQMPCSTLLICRVLKKSEGRDILEDISALGALFPGLQITG